VLETFDPHSLVFFLAGLAALGGALLPRLIGHLPASPPMVFLALGFGVFSLPLGLTTVDPIEHGEATEYLTEVGVIVALMGAGLKLDRPLGWRTWRPTVRLLAITMPLTILLTVVLGWWAVGLAPATALLLGAVLAPTDPVLASDVQVGPPGGGPDEEDDLRFSLTSEAGLNDALAFPFTNAAVALALVGTNTSSWLVDWLAIDVAYKLAAGLVGGLLVGKLLAVVVFRTPENMRLASRGEGFVALAGTFLAYGLTEVVGGYGFLAVFVAAVVLRRSERHHQFHETLHDFAEQTEQLLMITLVVLLGGAVAGGILAPLTWQAALAGLAVLFVVRPVTAWIGLLRTATPKGERAAISFFGIRGIGSIYYLAYALNHATFSKKDLLWALVAFTIVVSIIVHGTTATFVTRRLDVTRDQMRPAPRPDEPERDQQVG
jgi:NhaP-type Na+/H+ or K+/H+ antiporter